MKFCINIIFVLLLFCSFSLKAEMPKAVISLMSENSTVKEGDIVEGMIKVWPLESAELDEFKKIENTTLMGILKIVQVQSVELSANNADVVEIKVIMAIMRTKHQSDYSLFYKGHAITIEPLNFKLTDPLNLPKDYFILDQAISTSLIFEIFLLALMVMLAGLFFIKRKQLVEWIARFRVDPIKEQMNYFDLLFSKANTRKDFEQVYATRKQWMNFLEGKQISFESFFQSMEKHQYKKEWSDSDLTEVLRAFEGLRGSFK